MPLLDASIAVGGDDDSLRAARDSSDRADTQEAMLLPLEL